MATGTAFLVGLYAVGFVIGRNVYDLGFGPPPLPRDYGPYYLLGFDPCVWGLAASLAAGVAVSLLVGGVRAVELVGGPGRRPGEGRGVGRSSEG